MEDSPCKLDRMLEDSLIYTDEMWLVSGKRSRR